MKADSITAKHFTHNGANADFNALSSVCEHDSETHATSQFRDWQFGTWDALFDLFDD